MTRSDSRARHGAHRTRRDATRALVPSLLAVLAVSSLITALYVWRGEQARAPQAATATTGALTETSAGAKPSATSQPGRTSEATTSPAPSVGTSSGGTSSGADPSGGGTSRATETAPRSTVALVVLNQTRRSGLAGVVADRLRGRGWTVAGVGNFRGTVPATTVYYPAGAQAQAQTAARNLPTPARIRPRFGNLSATRLTIVVTDNYPS